MTDNRQQQAADELFEAHRTGRPIQPVTGRLSDVSPEFAYAVQEINTKRWLQAGRTVVGCKIGLTSKAVQKAFGIDQPDYGMLFDDMAYADADPVPLARLIQPRVEGEVAFCVGRDITEPLSLQGLVSAIDYAVPALEIVDSRVADWKIGITDTIADNASSGVFVLGSQPVSLNSFDHRLCGMVVEHLGEPISTGAGAACLGNPITATWWLAKKMIEVGRPLRAGDIVLSGALGPMVSVKGAGVYELRVNGLGSVRAVFETSDLEAAA